MSDFRDYKSLFKYINQNIKLSLDQVAQQVQQMVKDFIIQELYQNYKPTEYDRTYEFLNSVSVSKVEEITKGKYMVQIYFDTSLIHPYITSSFWNAHASVTGHNMSSFIPLFLEEGTDFPSLYPREGIHSMETIREDLDRSKKYMGMIKEFLEKKGFKVELGGL